MRLMRHYRFITMIPAGLLILAAMVGAPLADALSQEDGKKAGGAPRAGDSQSPGKNKAQPARKRLGKKGICDLCNARVGPDDVVYSADEFKTAVRAGLRPSDSVLSVGTGLGVAKKNLEAAWVRQVMADRTDWACCPACAAGVEKHLGAAKAAPARAPDAVAACLAAYEQGNALRRQGKVKEAIQQYEKAVALADRAFGKDQNTATLLNNLSLLYHEVGDYDRAERLGRQGLVILDQILAPDDPLLAKSLDNLAQAVMARKRPADAAPLFARALKIREKRLAANDLDLSVSLNNLANAYEALKRFDEAEALYLRSLKVAEKAKGPNDPTVALVLNNLGVLYQATNRLDEAEKVLTRARQIRAGKLPANDPREALTSDQLAEVAHQAGDLAKAAGHLNRALAAEEKRLGADSVEVGRRLLALGGLHQLLKQDAQSADYDRRALKILEAKLGRMHPELSPALQRLGMRSIFNGELAQAEDFLQRALQIRQKENPDGLEAATVLCDLGHLYRRLAQYRQAEELSKKGLAIREKRLPADHPDVAQSLSNLGVVYQSTAQYARAEPLFRRALKVAEARKDDEMAASVLNNLGTMYAEMRLVDEAEDYLRRALALKEAKYGRDHPSVAVTLDNLAGLYHRRDAAQARTLYERALKIREARLAPDHPAVAVTLHNLGEIALNGEEFEVAADLFRRSLAIAEARLGKNHPMVANSLNYLAHTCMASEDYAAAEKHLLRGLAIREAALPKNHPELLISVNYLHDLYALTGRWDQAVDAGERSRRITRAYTRDVLPFLPEADQLAFDRRYRDGLDHALSLAVSRADDPRVRDLSAAWVLNSKGVIQEALAERWALAGAAPDETTARLVQDLLDVRSRLASLTMQPPADDGRTHREALAALMKQERELSGQVGRATGEERADDPWIDLAAVRRALPAEAALVAVSRYRETNYTRAKLEGFRYAAWVVPATGKGDVRLIDLGPVGPINAAVARLREAYRAASTVIPAQGQAAAERALRGPAEELARLVLRPLTDAIGDVPRWVVSPDGALWLVPWEALPLADGRYVIEKHQVHYVVSGRELLRRLSPPATGRPVMFADPDYNLAAAPAELPPGAAAATRSRAQAEMKWEQLRGSAAEAAAVVPRLARYAQAEPDVYTGAQAREATFKSLRRPRALVLSTHGFFLDDQDDQAPAVNGMFQRGVFIGSGRPAAAPPAKRPAGTAPPGVENPLLRCGLVLAGANRRDQAGTGTRFDGVLTGLEIVGTDLRGTELVVLSACETGLGKVHDAEGVAGLRQAFHLAGARTVVATLWQIPDIETAVLMSTFFEGLASGRDHAGALRHAQLEMIRSQRETNGAAHPFYWAAFTLTGNLEATSNLPAVVAASGNPTPAVPVAAVEAAADHSTPALAAAGLAVCLLAAGVVWRVRKGRLGKSEPAQGMGRRSAPPSVPAVPGYLFFFCSRCRSSLRARADLGGNRTSCPTCKQKLRIPTRDL